MTNDDIAHLRLLADWHDRQARYLLLSVPAGQQDQGRFHFTAAARLSRLADEANDERSEGETQLTGFRDPVAVASSEATVPEQDRAPPANAGPA